MLWLTLRAIWAFAYGTNNETQVMKAHKITLLITDHDEVGEAEIRELLENGRYPNHCIDPKVMAFETAEIGEWHDDHPLNKFDQQEAEYQRLFSK